MPEFEPSPNDFYIYLTTTNKLAADINSKQLAKLKKREELSSQRQSEKWSTVVKRIWVCRPSA